MIIDFKCSKCNKVEEHILPSINCTEYAIGIVCDCGNRAKPVLSAPKSFVLKGQGFYKPSRG